MKPAILFFVCAAVLVVLTWATVLTVKAAVFVGLIAAALSALLAFDGWLSEKMIAWFFTNRFGKKPRRKAPKIRVVDDSHLD